MTCFVSVSNLIDFRSSPLDSGSCDKNGGNLTVVCGDVNLHNPGPGRQSRRVSNILIHPGFDPKTLINDFAVLVAEKPFELTEYVGAVCLPDPGDSTEVKLSSLPESEVQKSKVKAERTWADLFFLD